jgi:RNA polymerase sigma-70 factor (ECF subfamily)
MSLVLANQKRIYVYILSLVIRPADADDILQDTLAIMWKKFDEFKIGTDFVAWGKTIARYKIMNHLKKNQSSKLLFDDDVLEAIEAETGKMDNLADRMQAMRQCLGKLPAKEMCLLNMRYTDDLSFSGIALQLGVSKQSAYKVISRIHSVLAKCINRSLQAGALQ